MIGIFDPETVQAAFFFTKMGDFINLLVTLIALSSIAIRILSILGSPIKLPYRQ